MRSRCFVTATLMAAVIVMLAAFGHAPAEGASTPSNQEPIVIVYICDLKSQGVPVEWMDVAVKQINESGGILGRELKFIYEDCKGETTLAVQGYARALMTHKATIVGVYPRSEIALACEAKAGELFPEYPHIFLAVDAGADQITDRIATDYDKWKFVFRDNCAEPGRARAFLDIVDFFSSLGAKKMALLREDLMWTEKAFKGIPPTALCKGLPSMKERAQELGMEIVYEKALKYRAGMYSPILEKIAAAGADCCVFIASAGNDSDVFVRQWATSSARNIHMSITAACGSKFWRRTGGQALGVVYTWGLVPLLTGAQTPEIPDIYETAIKYQLDLDAAVLFSAYADMFFIKKAIEKAGGTDDINALITAMEETEIVGPMGTLRYQTERIPPFCHSAAFLDPKDPMKYAERGFRIDTGQFQKGGKIVLLTKPFPGVEGSPNYYKTPAELRK